MPKISLPSVKKLSTANLTQLRASYNENPWIGLPESWKDKLGFVYLIRCKIDNRWYVGKKLFTASGGKKGRTKIRKESDWRNYWGSSKELVAHISKHGKENFTREILSVHDTKFDLMYAELLAQIKYDVVHDPLTFNGVINMRSYLPRSLKRQKI